MGSVRFQVASLIDPAATRIELAWLGTIHSPVDIITPHLTVLHDLRELKLSWLQGVPVACCLEQCRFLSCWPSCRLHWPPSLSHPSRPKSSSAPRCMRAAHLPDDKGDHKQGLKLSLGCQAHSAACDRTGLFQKTAAAAKEASDAATPKASVLEASSLRASSASLQTGDFFCRS